MSQNLLESIEMQHIHEYLPVDTKWSSGTTSTPEDLEPPAFVLKIGDAVLYCVSCSALKDLAHGICKAGLSKLKFIHIKCTRAARRIRSFCKASNANDVPAPIMLTEIRASRY